jgi:8-oxo-dGTP pyrophosphatase MutT (NUDIX family)
MLGHPMREHGGVTEVIGARAQVRWKVVSDRSLYTDEWLDIRIADVELPDGRHLAHRWIRTPPGAGVVAIDSAGRVLLIWRHRFITNTWGWEIPIGKIEHGEPPIDAAAREFEEETGWRPGELRHLLDVQPTPGLSNSEHHIYLTREATYAGSPVDSFEAERIEWVSLSGVCSLIENGDVASGTTLAALLFALNTTHLREQQLPCVFRGSIRPASGHRPGPDAPTRCQSAGPGQRAGRQASSHPDLGPDWPVVLGW